MWKKWLLLPGIIFIVHLDLPRTSAERANPVGGLGLSVGEPVATRSMEDPPASEITMPLVRGRRSVATAMQSLSALPFTLAWNLLALPMSVVEYALNWGTGVFANIAEEIAARIFQFAKNSVIPRLDEWSMKLLTVQAVPKGIKDMIVTAHSTYAFMKLFGYLNPA